MNARLSLVAISAAAALLATPALAQSIPEAGLTGPDLAKWLETQGLDTTVIDKNGQTKVRTTMEGMPVYFTMMDCNGKPTCQSVLISVGYDMKDGITYQRANEWNSGHRWAMMSLDDEMDPYLTMDVSLSPKGSYEALSDAIATWQNMMGQVRKFLGL